MEMMILWIILIVFFIASDALTGTLMTIWFAIGAFAALVISLMGLGVPLQIIFFLVVSAVMFFFTKPVAQKSLKRTLVKTNIDAITEKSGQMTKTVSELEYGEVKVDGKYWVAITNDRETIEQGETVDVIGVEGVKLIVKRREN